MGRITEITFSKYGATLAWDIYDDASDLDDRHKARAFPVAHDAHERLVAELPDCAETCANGEGPLHPAPTGWRYPMLCGARQYADHIFGCPRMRERLGALETLKAKRLRLRVAVRVTRELRARPERPLPRLTDAEVRERIERLGRGQLFTDQSGLRWKLYRDVQELPERVNKPVPLARAMITHRAIEVVRCGIDPTRTPLATAQRWLESGTRDEANRRDAIDSDALARNAVLVWATPPIRSAVPRSTPAVPHVTRPVAAE